MLSSSTVAPPRRFTALARLATAIALAYFVAYAILPWLPVWESLVVRSSIYLLQGTPAVPSSNSGDTTFHYVELVWFATLAVLAGLVLVWRGPRTPALSEALRVVLRYQLAFSVLLFGLSQVWLRQYPFPSFASLTTTLGDTSPMELLWTFMGYSPNYSVFQGVVAVIGSLLLLSRRTTLAGALVLLGVVGNLVALGFCFDVPMKIQASNLLVMAALLVLPDFGRLLDFLALNHATEPIELSSTLWDRFPRRAYLGAKGLVCIVGAGAGLALQFMDAPGPSHQLAGVYDVVGAPFQRMILERDGHSGNFDLANDNRLYFQWDLAGDVLNLKGGETQMKCRFRPAGTEEWKLDGDWLGTPFHANLIRRGPDRFPLARRGFHWVNEEPYLR